MHRQDFTPDEAMAFHDGDPVAGTEFREMATLFVQMHEFVCDFAQALALHEPRPESHGRATGGESDPVAPHSPPYSWPPEWTKEAVRIMNARAQALHDNTRAFTRPIRR